MSLRARIIISYLLIIGIGFFYLVKRIIDVKEIKPRYMESVEESMVDTAQLLASLLEGEVSEGRLDPQRLGDALRRAKERKFVAQIFSKQKTDIELGLYITDAHGIVVYDSDGGRHEGQDFSRWNDVYLTLQGRYGTRSTRLDPNDPNSSILHVAAPIRHGGQIIGVLTVSKPQRSVATFMLEARKRIVLMGAIAGGIVIVIGSLFSTWLTRPIQRLTEYAKAVRDGRRVALPALGSSEIKTLGRTIEDMRDALEGKKYVENYVQTLTHEIKSPVAAIRGASELLREEMPVEQRDRFLENIQAETIRIQELIDRLLLLSAVEARKTLEERQPVDLAAKLRETAASMEATALAHKVALEVRAPDRPCFVAGDAFLLERALLNLLQNAIAFSPEGGAVELELECQPAQARVSVRDRGPGIPAYALPRVFERFFSLPRPRSGKKSSGLGLAFVQEVAALHGGKATLENRAEGGASAALELPRGG